MTRMSLSSDNTRPIDSRGRASPPGEASSGEFIFLSGVTLFYTVTFKFVLIKYIGLGWG